MTLPRHKVEELALFYESGATVARTARVTSVSVPTVTTYFRSFLARALPRRRLPQRWKGEQAPEPYLGPPWIGVATTELPEPIGSDWIGKAMP